MRLRGLVELSTIFYGNTGTHSFTRQALIKTLFNEIASLINTACFP
jgi:hypothetical protein